MSLKTIKFYTIFWFWTFRLVVSIHSNVRKWNSDNGVIDTISMGETREVSTETFVAARVPLQ